VTVSWPSGSFQLQPTPGYSWVLGPADGKFHKVMETFGAADDNGPVVAIPSGETVTLTFVSDLVPDTVQISTSAETGLSPIANAPPTNPTRFVLDLPPGLHAITIGTTWSQGGLGYTFQAHVPD